MTAFGLPAVQGLRDGDPTSLGQYRIAGRLGQGGMGTVFLAEGPSGPVAIKMITPHLAADPEFVRRFRREVSAARLVRRFCTAPVLDTQLDAEPLWVVTEYVAGPDLARVLREHGPLAGSNLEALAVGVATALTAIHGAGVVHRDLKPGNVLLSSLGPRVIDFGIARAFESEDGRTVTGRLLGTPEYMAPEAVSGEVVGPASDIFAWGCVVYAAALGRSPFASRTVPEALMRVVNDHPTLEGIDPALRETVAAALEKDPQARPTAQELVARLVGNGGADTERVAGTIRLDLASIGGSPPPAPPTAVAGRPARRRALIGTAALVAAAVLAGAALLVPRLLPDGPPAPAGTLYQESFDADTSGWPTDSAAYAPGGKFVLKASGGSPVAAKAPINAEIPDRLLLDTTFVLAGDPSGRGGVYCGFSTETTTLWYNLEVRRDGRARITRNIEGDSWSLTAEILVPDFKPASVRMQAQCSQEGDDLRLALWLNGRKAVEAADARPKLAGVKPTFGLWASHQGGDKAETEVTYEDFTVGWW